jgi:hypothetical protein
LREAMVAGDCIGHPFRFMTRTVLQQSGLPII